MTATATGSLRPALGKAALRQALLSRRAALSPGAHARADRAAVDALLPAADGRVAAYLAVGTEPATALLLAALAERSVEVLLPVLLPGGDLDWALAEGGTVPGPHGLLEPTGTRLGQDAIADCTLVVVPALAVDALGNRLGRGGGSYDRALGRTRARVVALLHDGEVLDRLPVEPHDRPVHAAVTPGRGVVDLTGGERT